MLLINVFIWIKLGLKLKQQNSAIRTIRRVRWKTKITKNYLAFNIVYSYLCTSEPDELKLKNDEFQGIRHLSAESDIGSSHGNIILC